MGNLANASGLGGANTASGFNANASGANGRNTATGVLANASGDNSANTASGLNSQAGGTTSFNTATGRQATASGNGSHNVATGDTANAQGDNSSNIATGNSANSSGSFGSSNVAIGDHADAHGDGTKNTAVGANSVATGNSSSAFGSGASAAFVNSAAFGAGATVTRANQQVFGTATNTYTLPGVASAASAAAQSGPTQFVTSDASGNLATTSFASLGLGSGPTSLSSNLTLLSNKTSKAFTGVAMAFALAGVPVVLPDEKFVLSTNWGTFQGENGAAMSAAFRLFRNLQLHGGFAYGFRENIAGGQVGVRLAFGKK